MDIDSANVIRVILQFLLQNKLEATAQTLIKESGGIRLTAPLVDSKNILNLIEEGQWVELLKELSNLSIEPSLMTDLFAHVVHELCFAGQMEAAKALLTKSEPLGDHLRKENLQRYLDLEEMCITDPQALSDPKSLRQQLDLSPLFKVNVAKSNRLMTLMGQAVKYQLNQMGKIDNGAYDPFLDIFTEQTSQTTLPFTEVTKSFSVNPIVECNIIIEDNEGKESWLVLGDKDGFISIVDPLTGELCVDGEGQFGFQEHASTMMVMESAVSSMFAYKNQLLVTSDCGEMLLWDAFCGKILQRFIVEEGVSFDCCLFVSVPNLACAISSKTNSLHIFSGKSGAQLQTLKLSNISSACSLSNEKYLLVGYKNGGLDLFTIVMNQNWPRSTLTYSEGSYTPISSICPFYTSNSDFGWIVACGRSVKKLMIGVKGIGEFQWGPEFLAPTHVSFVRFYQRWVYVFDDSRTIHVVDFETWRIKTTITTRIGDESDHVQDVLVVPSQGLLVSLKNFDDNTLRFLLIQ